MEPTAQQPAAALDGPTGWLYALYTHSRGAARAAQIPTRGTYGPHHQRTANTRGPALFDSTPPHRRTLVLGTAGALVVYDVAAATGALSLTLTRPPRPTFNHPTPNPSRKPLSGALSLRASSALGTCDEAAPSPGKVI